MHGICRPSNQRKSFVRDPFCYTGTWATNGVGPCTGWAHAGAQLCFRETYKQADGRGGYVLTLRRRLREDNQHRGHGHWGPEQ